MKKMLTALALAAMLTGVVSESASATTLPVSCPAGQHRAWTFVNGMAFYKCVAN
jgi:RNase adaptor protein for sRNA GlmZ degradation